MLYANHILFLPNHPANQLSRSQSLFDIQITAGLIKHIHIHILTTSEQNGKPLQLSPTQLINIPINNAS